MKIFKLWKTQYNNMFYFLFQVRHKGLRMKLLKLLGSAMGMLYPLFIDRFLKSDLENRKQNFVQTQKWSILCCIVRIP